MYEELLTARSSSPVLPGRQNASPQASEESVAEGEHHLKGRNHSTHGNGSVKGMPIHARAGNTSASHASPEKGIHPSWLALIKLCRELGYGEIERLSIQDGLPVLAETVRKKVRFGR